MRVVSIVAHGRFYAPAPAVPSPAFFRHLCELGEAAFDDLDWRTAAYWFRHAYNHVPPSIVGQPREVSERFLEIAEHQSRPELVARKLRAGCEVLKGALP